MGNISLILGRGREYFDAHRKEATLAVIVFLIGAFCFGIGYLSGRDLNRAAIIIEKCSVGAG